jgi:hypothetical protein
MKKILTHLTGIVFLIAILAAGGCDAATTEDDPGKPIKYPDEVTIFLKAYEDGDNMRLLMYDSTNDTLKEAEIHTVDVGPGTKVIWRRANDSNIKSIKKVGPKLEKGPIFPGDATTILLNKRRRITVPTNTPVPEEEAEDIFEQYIIIFKDKNNDEWPIDPYLRIRDR